MRASSELSAQRSDADAQADGAVGEINALATQIGGLNDSIAKLVAVGQAPNDLLDVRDKLLDDLSKLAPTTVSYGSNSVATVTVGGLTVVDPSGAISRTRTEFDGQFPTPLGTGKLGALLDVYQNVLPGYQARLDELAVALHDDVNAVHQSGFDLAGNAGGAFFAGASITGAADLAVDPALIADASKVAAAGAPGAPGDSANALRIIGLRTGTTAPPVSTLGTTYDDFYTGLISDLGVAAQTATRDRDTVDAVVNALTSPPRERLRRLARRGDDEPRALPARVRGRRPRHLDDGRDARHDREARPVMRATGSQVIRQTLFDLNHVTEQLAKDQRQLSGGKAINQPEDDPFGAGRALFLRGEVGDVQQFQRTINEGTAWLETTDIALNNVTGAVQRLRELVVQAANGTNDQGGLDAIKAEVAQLKESIREQANSTFAGRYIFSGTTTTTKPYPAPSNANVGNTGAVQRHRARPDGRRQPDRAGGLRPRRNEPVRPDRYDPGPARERRQGGPRLDGALRSRRRLRPDPERARQRGRSLEPPRHPDEPTQGPRGQRHRPALQDGGRRHGQDHGVLRDPPGDLPGGPPGRCQGHPALAARLPAC